MQHEILIHNFKYHKPDENKIKQHEAVREITKQLAIEYNKLPDGREKAIALTKLEEAMFWANAAIARQQVLHR